MAYRNKEIEKAKVEIVKIFTSIWDQELKLKTKQMLNQDMNTKYTQEWDKTPLSSITGNMIENFPLLLRTLKEKKGALLNERGQILTRIKVRNIIINILA